MPAPTTTLAQLRSLARRLSDMESTDFVSDAEIDSYIRLGVLDLYDQLDQVAQQEYFLKTIEIPLTPPQNAYDLPSDFARVKGVDFSTSAFPPVTETLDDGTALTRWVPEDEKTNVTPIRPYTFFDRHRLNQGSAYGPTTVAPYDAEEMKYRVFTEKREITTTTPQPPLIVCNPEPCDPGEAPDLEPDGWVSTGGETTITFDPWPGDPSGAPFELGHCLYAFGEEGLNCYGVITSIDYTPEVPAECPPEPEEGLCCQLFFQNAFAFEGPNGNVWWGIAAFSDTCPETPPSLGDCAYFDGSFRGVVVDIDLVFSETQYQIDTGVPWFPAERLPPTDVLLCEPPVPVPASLEVTFDAECTDISTVRVCGEPDFPIPQPPIVTTECAYYDRIRFQKVKQGYALVWYLPRHPDIEECGFVGFGFDDYPAVYAAIRMLRKEESDFSGLTEDLEMMKKRIRTMAGIRDVGHPVPTQDTTTGWE